MTVLTEYSLWFILLCLLLGAVFAFILYFRNKSVDYGKRPNWIMASLRGVSIALIAFLLLAPMLKLSVKQVDKPVLLFAIDNSESMKSTSDSAFYKGDFQQKINNLIHAFSDKYDVKAYLIGDKNALVPSGDDIAVPFTDKTTDLSSIFDELDNVYANRNIGAMVLISDGIFNTGFNPQYKATGVQFPIHTVGTGNTESQVDLSIAGILHNKQTYIGNFFPVEIKISANRLSSKHAKLTVYDKENEVFSKDISISGNQYFENVKFSLEAKEKGTHKYRVEVTELDGEVTYKNNATAFFIEVVDSREKIAIIYHAPHPDVSAIRQALILSDKYEVETYSAADFKQNPNDYSLLILHQLPSKTQTMGNLLTQIQQNHLSALYILGSQSDLGTFNKLNTGLTLTQNRSLFNESTPVLNDNFLLFTFSEELRQMLTHYTPLNTFFGNYSTNGNATRFLNQKINNVVSNYPLILFSQNNNSKVGVIAGEGIWRWRMQNYLQVQNFDAFDEMMNKIALYLSVKGDRSLFRVHAEEVYAENKTIELTAELYNESYELISDPDVNFILTDGEGKKYTSQFSKRNNAYYLQLGKLPVGDYTWEATTKVGTAAYRKTGHFTVQEIVVESLNLVANHDLLQTISQNTNGKFFTVNDMEKIEQVIKDNENIKPIVSYNKKYSLLLNSWIYLLLIILLLGIEWFIRKWGGGY